MCEKTFKNKTTLATHIVRLHSPKEKCNWDDCNHWAKNKEQLRVHENFQHKGKSFDCPYDKLRYRNTSGLKKHLKNIHKLKQEKVGEIMQKIKKDRNIVKNEIEEEIKKLQEQKENLSQINESLEKVILNYKQEEYSHFDNILQLVQKHGEIEALQEENERLKINNYETF